MKTIRLSYQLTIILSVLFFGFVSCEDEPDEYIPQYEEQILLEQPDTSYGELSVEVVYDYNGRFAAAPPGTWVELYQTSEDLALGIPMYKFEIYNQENFIYFGYLARGTYYILAYSEIGFYDYEGTKSIQIIGDFQRETLIEMKQIITQ